ncbi:MAG: hypothetical protein H0X41_10415 [Chitinophagaceae bacterium]|nr:hypothetical protein [Chitinophagaceae bacterium]
MKKKLSLVVIMLIILYATQAQLYVGSPESQQESIVLNPLAQSFSNFIKAVKPSAFSGAFAKQKSNFLSAASAIGSPSELGKHISQLCGFLKSTKLKTTFRKADFMKASLHTATMEGAKGLLKDLESNLKPDAMTDIWKMQRNSWLAELNGDN